MLCKRCSSISFQPLQIGSQPERSVRNAGSDVIYILHHDRASFTQSLSAGCHLCTLIEAKLNRAESLALPTAYRSIKAYIILKTVGQGFLGSLPQSLSVISLRGTLLLDIIEPVAGLTPSFLGYQDPCLTNYCYRYYDTQRSNLTSYRSFSDLKLS